MKQCPPTATHTHTRCAPAHEGDDVSDHLVVVLDVGAVGVQRAVGIKGDQLQELGRGVHLRVDRGAGENREWQLSRVRAWSALS